MRHGSIGSRRVLVVGGTRFLGYALVWRLLAAGHRVTVFNRGRTPDPFEGRVDRILGDRTGPDFADRLSGRRFDAVVDFLAFHASDVEAALEAFGGGRAGHYVFVGTGQVYLVRKGCPTPAAEADYEGPLLPEPTEPSDREQWAYGIGKRGCEDLLAAHPEFPSTRIRIPMVNGERDHRRRLEGYLRRILDGGPLLLPDGGANRTRHVYSGAVARTIADLLGREATFGEAFNLCQEEMPALAELVRMIGDLLGARPRLLAASREAMREAGLDPAKVSPFSTTWMSFLDPGKAKASLGFRHEPLREYLGSILASFLAHPPEDPPEEYATRAKEISLAARLGPGAHLPDAR
ncbi:MAG: NAD-dependent epimerase/dehydratase family protein [Planctomycetota bacterium]